MAGMQEAPSLQYLLDQVRTAVAERTPLQIRGGGSKDFVGRIAPARLLDTRSHSGIVDYAPSELVVTAAAGTSLSDLEATLAEKGQCLPFEPPHLTWSCSHDLPSPATVGGMVASGLAGPARANVGGVRDYVLGVQLINGQGQHLTFGGQVMKNVAGYDVSRLMVGAMGTLGVITQVSLKVLPMAPAEASLQFPIDQVSALEQLHRWGGQPLPLHASRWQDGQLVVRLRGAVAAVEAACRQMLAALPGQRQEPVQAAADWALCRHQRLPFFLAGRASGLALWRLSVPQTAPVLDVPWPPLVEWHGGLRWFWAPQEAAAQLQAVARAAGGTASVYLASQAGTTGAEGPLRIQNAVQDALAQRLKAAFDPLGLLNPGRLALTV